jgi:hypothetical protein
LPAKLAVTTNMNLPRQVICTKRTSLASATVIFNIIYAINTKNTTPQTVIAADSNTTAASFFENTREVI